MRATTLFEGESVSVIDYRCDARPADTPFVEVYDAYRLSYVRRGSFGCRAQGRAFEFVAGSVKVGRPGDEYMATHEHHECGDECLSVGLSEPWSRRSARSGRTGAWSACRRRRR